MYGGPGFAFGLPTIIEPMNNHLNGVELLNEADIAAINRVCEIFHRNATLKGFHPEPPNGELPSSFVPKAVANIHGEASELWEAYRKGNLDKPCDKPGTGLTCQSEELADLFIRVCDVAKELGTNLGYAVANKHQYNATRPYRHGDKCA